MNERIKWADDCNIYLRLGELVHTVCCQVVQGRFVLDVTSFQNVTFSLDGKSAFDQAFAAWVSDGDFRSFRPKPKVRPYTQMEYINLMNKFDPDEPLLTKNERQERYIDHLRIDRFGLTTHFKGAPTGYSVMELFDGFLHSDGSPCGVEETE